MSEFDQVLSAARIHLKAGRLADAASTLHILQALRPSDAEGWYRLGHVWLELDGDFQAAACLRETLRLAPDHAGARHDLDRLVARRLRRAEQEVAGGRTSEAIIQLGEASLLSPGDSRVRRALLGQAFAVAPEGAGLPSRTGEIDGYRFWQLHRELGLGAAALDQGDAEQAATRLGRVTAVATDAEADMRRMATAARAAIGEPATAPSSEGHAAALVGEAERLVAARRLEEAVGLLRRALALADDVGAVLDRLHATKLALTLPGPRVMPPLGLVDLAIEDGVWRLTPAAPKGRVLVISNPTLALADQDDPCLDNHAPWETRQIIRSLLAAGWAVDGIASAGPRLPAAVPEYDLVYSLQGGLAAVADRLPSSTPTVVWLTGSSPDYQNRREAERVAAMAARGRRGYVPKRQLDAAAEFAAIDRADRCVLLGNEHSLATYPPAARAKTVRLMPTASRLGTSVPIGPLAGPPEFLWLGGGGAVLKGLDLVLEAFAGMPDLTLHVVGFAADEPDFDRLYDAELYRLANVRLHGFLRTSGPEFARVLSRVAAVIAPSASEGASTSVATALAAGLLPVASSDIGIDLDEQASVPLAALSVEDIRRGARAVAGMSPVRLTALRQRIRVDAAARFSRERFADELDGLIRTWLASPKPCSE